MEPVVKTIITIYFQFSILTCEIASTSPVEISIKNIIAAVTVNLREVTVLNDSLFKACFPRTVELPQLKAASKDSRAAIIVLSLVFCILGVLIAIISDKKYNAELTFVVEDPKAQSSLTQMSGIASQFGFDLGGTSSSTFSESNIFIGNVYFH